MKGEKNMNKFLQKVAKIFLGLSMAAGVGVAIGAGRKDASAVHAGTANFTLSSASSVTVDGVTASFAKGSGSTAPTWYAAGLRLYAKNTVTISSSSSITGISFNWEKQGSKTFCGVTASTGSYTHPSAAGVGTWTGSATSIVFTLANTSGAQLQLNTFSVTYTSGATVSSVSSSGHKTSFANGETFSYGGTLTATYSDSTSKAVTPTSYKYGASGINPTSAGTAITTSTALSYATHNGQYIYVLYTESGTTVYTSYQITVSAPKTPGSVSSAGQTTTFDAGDTFTYGGTLTVTYTDSTNATVSPTSFKVGNAGINPTSAGTVITPGSTTLSRDDHNGKTVYVLYTENGTTVYTSYVITVNAISSVTFTAGIDTGSVSAQGTPDTITKSGISFYCTSWKNDSGTNYRLYKNATVTFTSTVGNMSKIEFTGNDGSYKISQMGSETTGTLVVDETNNKSTWTGDASTVSFTMTGQGRASTVVVTLVSNDPLVELAAGSATSVSMMKGDSDTSVKVHVANIASKTWTYTFDEDEDEGLSTSSYISVSAGAAVNDVHTLTITTKAVGSTVLHISVSGTACATTIPVTVAAKPASMTVVHSDISAGELEIITGAYKQVSFSGEDTDGNAYAIAAGDVTPSATSGSSHVTLSGSRITGASEGTAVVRYTLNALTSVYAEITVNVVDDYIVSVGTPTFATGLTDTQGDSPDVSVFTSRPGTMYSGTATTIPFENYKFSYESTYASAEYGSVFSYDFSHGTTVDSTHKLQTIYVFCDIDEAAHGSFTVTVEQLDDPLTAISFTNVTNNAVDVARGSTFQLEWAYTPTNPTDGKEVVFIIDDNDDGISITVSELGLISIGSNSALGTALVVMESAHDDAIYDYVYVSATLESMKYTVNETESLTPSSTVAVGDRVVMVAVDKNSVNYEFTAFSGASTNYGTATSYTTTVSKSMILTVVAGNSTGTVAFKTSDNEYVAWVSGKNSITNKASLDDYGSWTIDGSTFQNKQDTTRYLYLNYNNGTPRFACYADKSEDTTGNYTVPTFLKITGGNVQYDVTEELFNAIHNNFGVGKTYEWSDSCPAFDEDAWTDACEAILDLANYDDYKLNRAVADASGNEIEVFLAKYDFLVYKFGTNDYDYLGRYQTGGINQGLRTGVNPLVNIFGTKTNTVAIIVIISMVSVTAIGGYFFLRKRKEN